MTTYQSISGVRVGLQIATAALLYAAARYKKVDGLTSAASRIGIAAVVQGVSQKVHAPLGERTKMSWLADGISLGVVAYGMSYTDLAKRTKYLVGGAIFGSQLVISNLKPNTALARIDKIETRLECAEVFAELTQLFKENKETITPEQGVRTCKAFFQKAFSFTRSSRDSWENSSANRILHFYSNFLTGLEGWGKVKAHMEYIELMNKGRIYNHNFVEKDYFTDPLGLGEGKQAQVDLWMEKTGRPIQLRWLTWAMDEEKHLEVYNTITQYLDEIGDKITFAQKIDLCEQFYIKSMSDYPAEGFEGSPPENMLNFREQLMDTLDGIEKAKAYMDYVEFLDKNDSKYLPLFSRIIPEIRKTLDGPGKEAVDAWMVEKGTAIQEKWSE